MFRTACASIDCAALKHNFAQVRRFAPRSKIMSVIKANAYGHGMLEVANALADSDGFAVACVNEAVYLREHAYVQPITVLQGFADKTELSACVEYGLWPVVHHSQQLALLQAELPVTADLALWLKLTTGMNRLGFAAAQTPTIYRRLTAIAGVRQVRLMTHMARADQGPSSVASDPTQAQIETFLHHTAEITAERSLANSATLIAWPQAQYDWVRPGIMLYGASPFLLGNAPTTQYALKPVMQLSSRLIAINHCAAGQAVGYGGAWVCPSDSRIGVVAIGYGDGYPRAVDNTAWVSIRGQRAPLVGRVSMDLLTVDVTNIDAAVGDSVVLWGAAPTVDQIAASAGTIAYELLCNVSARVRHQYSSLNPR